VQERVWYDGAQWTFVFDMTQHSDVEGQVCDSAGNLGRGSFHDSACKISQHH